MSTENDVARSLRSWLRENRHEDANRVLNAVFDQVPATPQRRAGWLARRSPIMNSNGVRLSIGAAVLVLAAIVGIPLLAGPSVGGPSHPPAPTPSPTLLTIPFSRNTQPGTALEPGTYRILGQASEEMVATLPAGWFANSYARGGGAFRGLDQNEARLSISSVGSFVADPCPPDGVQGGALDPPIGPTVDDLVGALSALPIASGSAPVSITLDGYQGKQIELTYLGGIVGCDYYHLWSTPSVGEQWSATIQAGWSATLRILDVDGLRWVVITSYRLTGPSEVQRQLDQIVDSIKLRQ